MAGYTKQRSNWLDFPTTSTPILASNLNALETAIYDLKYLTFNVKDYGAIGDGVADDTAAIQAAINAAKASSVAIGRVYAAPGTYKVSAALTVSDHFGLHFSGASPRATTFLVSGTAATSLFDLNGIPHCTFENFSVTGAAYSTSHTVTNAINIHWSGSGSSTRRATFRNIYVYSLYFVNGIAIETVDSSKQNDEITIQDVVIAGGNATPGSPDATYWQAGIRIGSTGAVSGNTFQHLLLRPGIQGCKRGVHALATSLHSIGGGFQANTFDFSIHAPFGGSILVESLRSEQATRLLTDEVGYSGAPSHVTLRDIWWEATNMHADQNYIVYQQGGSLQLEQLQVIGATADPKISASSAALGYTIARARGCSFRTAPANVFSVASDANVAVILEDYVQTNAGGTATTAIFPGLFQFFPTVASATTTTLPSYAELVTISGTTTITSVTASYVGRRVTLVFSGALTFTDGSNLKLAGNFVTTADDTISLVCDGTNWIETGRSIN